MTLDSWLTILDGDCNIVPHWTRHMLTLGVTRFRVLTYGRRDDMQTVCDMVRAEGGEPQRVGILPSETFSARRREAFIESRHDRRQPAFFCDLDEFPALTAAQVRQFVAAMMSGQIPYVAGTWRDRVASDGKLRDVLPSPSIEEQYPATARLRQQWGMGSGIYVLSMRAPTLHHPNACRWGRRFWPDVPMVDVDHYRWQANVVTRLEKRLERIARVGKSGTPWEARVRAMLAHVKAHDGIDPSLLTRPAASRA